MSTIFCPGSVAQNCYETRLPERPDPIIHLNANYAHGLVRIFFSPLSSCTRPLLRFVRAENPSRLLAPRGGASNDTRAGSPVPGQSGCSLARCAGLVRFHPMLFRLAATYNSQTIMRLAATLHARSR